MLPARHPDVWPMSGWSSYSSAPPKSSPQGQGGQKAGPYHVVDEVGEGPDNRNAHKGDAEQHDVEKPNGQHIGEPDAPAVHYTRVGVHLAVRRAHIHPAAPLLPLFCKQAAQVRQVTPLFLPLTPKNSRQFYYFDSQTRRPEKVH